ncbi:MAG: DUF4351 domain-containing protein [Deltaproteobacteria bacterium]|nr:DUF4351 domain-containing protein [Deltaproteobacteria bacterium]
MQRRLRLGLMALKYALRVREQLAALDEILALAAEVPEMQAVVWVKIIETYRAVDESALDVAWRKHMPKLDVENASLIAKKWFAEGKAEGKAETLLRLLGRRFGEVSPRYRDAISAATIEDLDTWLDRAIDAMSIESVFVPVAH